MKTSFLNTAAAAAIFLAVSVAGYFLVRTGLPSSDVMAKTQAQSPYINVADFEPGDVRILPLNGLPIIVWNRNQADIALAASQNDRSGWIAKYSRVLGQTEPVYATEENLTLGGSWFFAVAKLPDDQHWVPLLRAGNFDGFFDVKYAGHYDLAGRIRQHGTENLTVVMGEMAEDGQTIRLKLGRQ